MRIRIMIKRGRIKSIFNQLKISEASEEIYLEQCSLMTSVTTSIMSSSSPFCHTNFLARTRGSSLPNIFSFYTRDSLIFM